MDRETKPTLLHMFLLGLRYTLAWIMVGTSCGHRLWTSDLIAARTTRRVRVACVGDSITYGYRGWAPPTQEAYPRVLQRLLGDGYNVTNFGNPGKTVQKDGQDWGNVSASYWQTYEFQNLSTRTWDIVVLQLGTNDAKDESTGGPPNWKHALCDSPASGAQCPYWEDLSAMIAHIRKLGQPEVFISIPPPVMKAGAFQINETVVNTILPGMIPKIAAENGIDSDHILNMFGALGGNSVSRVLPSGCDATMSNISGCGFFCDTAFCDNVHPSDEGFRAMASILANTISKVRSN